MPQPPRFVPPFDIASELGTQVGVHLDATFDTIVTVTNAISDNLGLIQRDDGQLKNQIVSLDALSTAALTLFSKTNFVPRGAWVTAIAYAVGDLISDMSVNPGTYICVTAHTSGTFATDLAASKWMFFSQQVQNLLLSNLTNIPSGNLAATNLQVALNELQSDIDTRATYASPALTGTPVAPTAAAGTNTTQLATTAFTQAALAAFPRYGNRIINGALLVDQRNAGIAVAVTSGTAVFPADRWMAWAGGAAVATATRISTGPGQFYLDYALNMQRTAGNAATVVLNLGQIIESVNWRALAGQAVTVSFYAVRGINFSGASNLLTANVLTGTANDQGRASLIAGTWTGQASASQTFALTTTWTRYSYTFTVPVGALEGSVVFSYTPTGTAGADDSFAVTGVDIRAGAILAAFDYTPIGDILRSCQRYYWAGAAPYISGGCNVNTTSAWIHTYNFPTTMRVAPTATMQGTWVSTGVTGLAVSGNSAATYAVSFNVAGPNANAAWTIAPNSADDRVSADAEL